MHGKGIYRNLNNSSECPEKFDIVFIKESVLIYILCVEL